MIRRSLLAVVTVVGLIPWTCAAIHAAEPHFVSRRGDQLLVGDEPLRFVSFNIPNLLVIEDAYSFTEPNPWRWPNKFEIDDALESVRQMGGQVVRTYVISVWREGSDMGETVHVRGPGQFNEEAFRALDKVLQVAREKGVRVIIPLVDNWKWMGGVPQYAAFRGKPPEAFWSDPELIADFKKTIDYVLNRRNIYTGIRYRDDPTIFGWETGNEIDATPAWTREIASYIKQLDPNHLVIDGRSLHGIAQWQLDEPHTDVVTTHHYPSRTPDFVPGIRAAQAAAKGRKPYFVGEFGFVETPRIKNSLDAVANEGVAGALLWSLRFHRREGGFYWHMEVGTGGNFYKAYHWPGFDSGSAYDEREVLRMMRETAFAIRGLEPPPREPPAAPKLLPIQHSSAISWQGAAGASGYDVQRAPQPAGPWTTIAENVSDADVQYRPLFRDPDARPGEVYYYRIIARNDAGVSPPSNVIGPVVDRWRTFVDECRDLALVHASQGNVAPRDDQPRRAQEDAHRLELAPGASITYRVDGPIQAWRVLAFAESAEAALEAAISVDGVVFSPVAVERRTFGSGPGDYGYLVPTRFEGQTVEGHQLRITLPADSEAPLQISRVEIDWQPGSE